MRKIELLSPVGNMDMMYMAIHNGADAIYLAGKSYGARKYAKNFSNEELVAVIKYAHLYGVKVYVTVNTVIYDSEIEDVLNYIEFLYRNHVDALIMQDIGIIRLVRKMFPNLEIHASTQCHNHNDSGLSFWKSLGLTRVVLDREMSLSEIKNIDVDIEKEVFIYGALCVSYSGCCLFSSLNGGRSGNRGECVGCCRLPYQLIKNGKRVTSDGNYLLSTNDLNVLDELDQLIEAGIDSLKIEGRMKSPSYVGYVTKCARKIIDSYYEGKYCQLTEEEIVNLKKLYHRGFTKGYLFNEDSIMNLKTPNHQGIKIGEVLDVSHGRARIKIVDDYLSQNDGIRFQNSNEGMIVNRLYDKNGLLVNKLDKNDIGYVDVKSFIKKNDVILKTLDYQLEQCLKDYSKKKIAVSMRVKAMLHQKLEIEISDGIHTVVKYGDIVEVAHHQSISDESFKKQLGKLGNTPFVLDDICISRDKNIFVRLSQLNELRRDLVDELVKKREEFVPHEVVVHRFDIGNCYEFKSRLCKNINVLARTEEQIEVCLSYGVNAIYVSDYSLYQKYKNKGNIYFKVSRVNMDEINYKDEKLLVGDLGSVYLYGKNNDVVGDYFLNVTNHSSVMLLDDLNIQRVTLSVELDYLKVKDLMEKLKDRSKIEIVVYGTLELMVMKYKIMEQDCMIEDKFHHQYPVCVYDNLSHVMQHEKLDIIDSIDQYRDLGIENFRLELFDETEEEVKSILSKI